MFFSRFGQNIEELKEYIKAYTDCLKSLIFTEGFQQPQNETKNEMLELIKKDDAKGLSVFLSKNPEMNIKTRETKNSLSLIDFSCFHGSLKCFTYLLLNQCEITKETLQCSIEGGNQEIVHILKENGHSFEDTCLETSVKYHRYELTKWLNENYKCKPVSLPKCIECYNFDAFLYFLEFDDLFLENDMIDTTCCIKQQQLVTSN